MFEAIQAKGDKAFVRLITNYGEPFAPTCWSVAEHASLAGNLNLELYCGLAPRTCYNFLKCANSSCPLPFARTDGDHTGSQARTSTRTRSSTG